MLLLSQNAFCSFSTLCCLTHNCKLKMQLSFFFESWYLFCHSCSLLLKQEQMSSDLSHAYFFSFPVGIFLAWLIMCDLLAQSQLVFQGLYICVAFRHPYTHPLSLAIIWIYSFSSTSTWHEFFPRATICLEQTNTRLGVIC